MLTFPSARILCASLNLNQFFLVLGGEAASVVVFTPAPGEPEALLQASWDCLWAGECVFSITGFKDRARVYRDRLCAESQGQSQCLPSDRPEACLSPWEEQMWFIIFRKPDLIYKLTALILTSTVISGN